MRFENDVVPKKGQAGASPDVLTASHFASQPCTRHYRQVATRISHDGSAGWAQNHHPAAQIREGAYVSTSQHTIDVPEETRQVSMACPEEVIREAVQEHTHKGRMRMRRRGGIALVSRQQRHEPAVIFAQSRPGLLPAKEFEAQAPLPSNTSWD